jgi:hypothetical protein
MNKYLEKIAAKIPKRIYEKVRDNPFLSNVDHVTDVGQTSARNAGKALDKGAFRRHLSQVLAEADAKIFELKKAKYRSGQTSSPPRRASTPLDQPSSPPRRASTPLDQPSSTPRKITHIFKTDDSNWNK